MGRGECGFVEPLLSWWARTGGRRGYPWRGERDPYRVLVAEVLLQRTRRDKVLEVYRAFLERFPTPRHLAEAPAELVEEAIEPLGLRKRASYLVRLARALLEKRDAVEAGRFEELPGVGPYAASAARLMLGIDTPLRPDASIARVFSRLFGKPLDRRRPADTAWVAETLEECAPRDPRGRRDYFLALIDLAWEVCRPRRPLCARCPLAEMCSRAGVG